METPLTSRRQWIALGLSAWAGSYLPARGFGGAGTPAWLGALIGQVAGLSTWTRLELGSTGEVAIHCGASDFAAWARHAGALAGEGRKVKAAGNTLTFTCADTPVSVVMHAELA